MLEIKKKTLGTLKAPFFFLRMPVPEIMVGSNRNLSK